MHGVQTGSALQRFGKMQSQKLTPIAIAYKTVITAEQWPGSHDDQGHGLPLPRGAFSNPT
jgi:hypothetical protein